MAGNFLACFGRGSAPAVVEEDCPTPGWRIKQSLQQKSFRAASGPLQHADDPYSCPLTLISASHATEANSYRRSRSSPPRDLSVASPFHGECQSSSGVHDERWPTLDDIKLCEAEQRPVTSTCGRDLSAEKRPQESADAICLGADGTLGTTADARPQKLQSQRVAHFKSRSVSAALPDLLRQSRSVHGRPPTDAGWSPEARTGTRRAPSRPGSMAGMLSRRPPTTDSMWSSDPSLPRSPRPAAHSVSPGVDRALDLWACADAMQRSCSGSSLSTSPGSAYVSSSSQAGQAGRQARRQQPNAAQPRCARARDGCCGEALAAPHAFSCSECAATLDVALAAAAGDSCGGCCSTSFLLNLLGCRRRFRSSACTRVAHTVGCFYPNSAADPYQVASQLAMMINVAARDTSYSVSDRVARRSKHLTEIAGYWW